MKQLVLTLDNVVDYLLNNNLIDKKSIVESDLKIIDESRRNRNFKVMRQNRSSYLVKQAIGIGRHSHKTLEIESKFYSFIMNCSSADEYIKKFIPELYFNDDKDKILVIRYLA